MTEKLSLGFSPCPNDTYIFYALVHGLVDTDTIRFADPVLEDVECLNNWALDGKLDITKLSFHAAAHLLDEYSILASGGALGRGCGPLLISGKEMSVDSLSNKRIAIPGKYTTAALLLQMFMPISFEIVEIRFDKIIDAIEDGEVDAGVIIHESRFTYGKRGLVCIQDLGAWWEEETGAPIPLGCIVARRNLGTTKLATINRVIRASVEYANGHFNDCLSYIQKHSQELDTQVVGSHIDLYVNDYSKDLGAEGRRAVELLFQKGRERGVLPGTRLLSPWADGSLTSY